MSLCSYGVCRVVSYPVLKRIRKNYNFFLAILAEETAMSVADLDSDPSHASAGDSDADDSEKLPDLPGTRGRARAHPRAPRHGPAAHSSSEQRIPRGV